MSTTITYACDGCGKEIGNRNVKDDGSVSRGGEAYTEITVSRQENAAYYSVNDKRSKWELCDACVEEIVDAIRAKAGEGGEE